MKFKQLQVKLEQKEKNNRMVYSAYVVQISASGQVKGDDLLKDSCITRPDDAVTLVAHKLTNYAERIRFI